MLRDGPSALSTVDCTTEECTACLLQRFMTRDQSKSFSRPLVDDFFQFAHVLRIRVRDIHGLVCHQVCDFLISCLFFNEGHSLHLLLEVAVAG